MSMYGHLDGRPTPVRAAIRLAGVTAAVITGCALLAGCGKSGDAAPGDDGTTGAAQATPTDQTVGTAGATDTGGTGSGGSGGGAGSGGSGGGGGGGGGAATKACQLVTSQEAATALGGTVNTTTDSAEECDYEAGTNAVAVSFTNGAYDAQTAGMLLMLPGVQKLDGIGDGAYKITLAQESQFHVWTKGKYLVIVVDKTSGDTATVGRALLDTALTRF